MGGVAATPWPGACGLGGSRSWRHASLGHCLARTPGIPSGGKAITLTGNVRVGAWRGFIWDGCGGYHIAWGIEHPGRSETENSAEI